MNKKFDINLLKNKVIKEKPVSDSIMSHKEKIRELRIKLYKLMRTMNEKV
jgi:hypothetical protein